MRTTINIDDDAFAKAKAFFGDMKPGEMINVALKEMVQRESAKRLAALGGSDPSASAPSRRPISLVAEDATPYKVNRK